MDPLMAVEVRRGSFRHKISLECPLCHYQFRSPKILPCYHSFCEACLYAVVSNSSVKTPTGTRFFSCPTCQARTEIQKGGVHTLQTNFVLAAQVIRQICSLSRPWCAVCATHRKATEEPVLATLKCWECDKFLCSRCQEVHRALLKFHTLIHLSQTGPVKVIRNTYCGKHPEEHLRFYCLKCEDTVCRDCCLTSHAEGHKTLDMADLQQSAKELVSKVNEVIVENFIPVLATNTQFFKRELEQKKVQKVALAEAIAKREKMLLKMVQEAAQEAQNNLDDVLHKMEEESRKYEDNLSRMRSETEFNEMVIESGCEADVMQAAINVMPYAHNKSPQACLVDIVSLKQELVWERKDTLQLYQPKDQPPTSYTLKEWKHFANEYLGQAAINVMPYAHNKSPQACLVDIVSLKQELVWERKDTLQLYQPKDQPPTSYTLKEWKHFANEYLGQVSLQKNRLTLSLGQASEESNLVKCFRKIGLLVEAYKKNYKQIASSRK